MRFRSYLLFGMGRYEEGFDASMAAYQLHPSPVVFRELGSILINFGFLDDARITLQELRLMNESAYGIYSEEIASLERELALREEEFIDRGLGTGGDDALVTDSGDGEESEPGTARPADMEQLQ